MLGIRDGYRSTAPIALCRGDRLRRVRGAGGAYRAHRVRRRARRRAARQRRRHHGQQFVSALAWWAIGGAGFAGGWATGVYLIAATREREFVYRLAQRFLIAVVFAVATAGGIMSKSGNLGGTLDVIAGLTALALD